MANFIVIDKNWLQATRAPEVAALLEGYSPVLTEALIFELGTSGEWTTCLARLELIASRVRIWPRLADALELEVRTGRAPTADEIDRIGWSLAGTDPRHRRPLAGDRRAFAEREHWFREAKTARVFESILKSFAAALPAEFQALKGRPLEKLFPRMIQLTGDRASVEVAYRGFLGGSGGPAMPDIPLPGGAWYRYTQALLAGSLEYIRRGEGPAKADFWANTMHDLDHALFGTFAGAIVTRDKLLTMIVRVLEPATTIVT